LILSNRASTRFLVEYRVYTAAIAMPAASAQEILADNGAWGSNPEMSMLALRAFLGPKLVDLQLQFSGRGPGLREIARRSHHAIDDGQPTMRTRVAYPWCQSADRRMIRTSWRDQRAR
jgi:hypothetical protein